MLLFMNRFPLAFVIRGVNVSRANLYCSSTIWKALEREEEGVSELEIHHSSPSSSSASDLEEHRDLGAPLAVDDLEEPDDLDDHQTRVGDGVQRLQSVCLPTVFLPPEMQEAVDSVLTGEHG